MPILNPAIPSPHIPTNAPVQITAPSYRGVTVDSKVFSADSLMAHVVGSAWPVLYYSQILDADSPLQGSSPNQSPVNQQYRAIREFELRVTAALTPSQDSETGDMVPTGTSNVYPVVKPNVGDVFLADVGDGREGVFEITDVRRMSMLKQPVHEIDYKFLQYVNQTYYQDLQNKTIDTVVFVYDFMTTGQNPLILEDDYKDFLDLDVQFHRIADSYIRSFLSNEFKTLITPEQNDSIYDPYLTNAVLTYLTTTDTAEIRYVRRLNCDGDDVIKAKSIWDVLTERNVNLFKRTATRAGFVNARNFTRLPMFEGVFYSGVQSVMYLKDPDLSVDAVRKGVQLLISGDLVPSASPTIDPDAPPLIPQVAATDHYVLSEAFYTKNSAAMSKLEIQVWNYLERRPVDVKVIKLAADKYVEWSDLERYYLGPVLLILMRSLMRSS